MDNVLFRLDEPFIPLHFLAGSWLGQGQKQSLHASNSKYLATDTEMIKKS